MSKNWNSIVQAGTGAAFTQRAADLDGTGDFWKRATALDGAVDGNKGTVFVSFSRANGTAKHAFFGSDNSQIEISMDAASDKIELFFKSPAGAARIKVISTTTFGVADQDYHTLLMSFDLANSGTRQFLIDGVDDSPNYVFFTDGDIDYTDSTGWGVGAIDDTGNSVYDGNLAVVYLSTTFIDLSVAANVAKFIDGNNKPVFMGYNGELPEGIPPLIFMAGFPLGNTGLGGEFIEQGNPTLASSFPTD